LPSGFTEKVLTVNDRPFMIRIISYENGNFISVTENSEKIAQKKQGICIITGNFEKVLDNETTKQLMETILEELK